MKLLEVLAIGALLIPIAVYPQTFLGEYEDFESIELIQGFTLPSSAWIIRVRETPSGHLLLALKSGEVYVVSPEGDLLPDPFLDIRSQVSEIGDGGLTDIIYDPHAFDPGVRGHAGDGSHQVYALYCVDPNGDDIDNDPCRFGRVSRFDTDPNRENLVAIPESETILLGNDFSDSIVVVDGFHLTDCLAFGSDRSLFVSAGESGAATTDSGCFGGELFPEAEAILPTAGGIGRLRAQFLDSFGGKVLRIDPETGQGYPSNPYYNGDPDAKRSKIWALGLRNPWRISVIPDTGSHDPADGNPGTVIIGDVGRDTWEEINISDEGGENFGWPYYEHAIRRSFFIDLGSERPQLVQPDATFTSAILAYHHSNESVAFPTDKAEPDTMRSILAGPPLSADGDFPDSLKGHIIIGDTSNTRLFEFVLDDSNELLSAKRIAQDFPGTNGGSFPVAISTRQNGNLLIASLTSAQEIRYNPDDRNPEAVIEAVPLFGSLPLEVSFDGSSSFDPEGLDLTYLWEFGDAGTSTSTEIAPVFIYDVEGIYQIRLTVEDPAGNQDIATVTVSAGNFPPTATVAIPEEEVYMALPEEGVAEHEITSVGYAVDEEDASLDLSYYWELILHHDNHTHVLQTAEDQTFFDAEIHDEATQTFHEIRLTATDSGGLSSSDSSFIYPYSFTEPEAAIACEGATASFGSSVVTTFDRPFAFRWYRGDSALANGPSIEGADSLNLRLLNVSPADLGDYSLEITSDVNVIRTRAASLTLGSALEIVSHPLGGLFETGELVELSVGIIPISEPVSFRWLRDGIPVFDDENLDGADTPEFTILQVGPSDFGSYSCRISSLCSEVVSENALVLCEGSRISTY